MLYWSSDNESIAIVVNLIQQSIEADKNSIGDKVVYFSNKSVCKKINDHDDVATLPKLTSDNEEVDMKLVVFTTNCNGTVAIWWHNNLVHW